jgi:hypothetical protein
MRFRRGYRLRYQPFWKGGTSAEVKTEHEPQSEQQPDQEPEERYAPYDSLYEPGYAPEDVSCGPRQQEAPRAFSGQLRLRLPSSLHEALTEAAALEGVSLNQFIAAVLAGAVNWSGHAGGRQGEIGRVDNSHLVDEMWRRILR